MTMAKRMDHNAASKAIAEAAEILKEQRAYFAENQREAAALKAGYRKAKKAKKKR